MKDKENKKGAASGLYICQRIITILLIVGAFFPTFNPTRVAKMTVQMYPCLHQQYPTTV